MTGAPQFDKKPGRERGTGHKVVKGKYVLNPVSNSGPGTFTAGEESRRLMPHYKNTGRDSIPQGFQQWLEKKLSVCLIACCGGGYFACN